MMTLVAGVIVFIVSFAMHWGKRPLEKQPQAEGVEHDYNRRIQTSE